MLVQFINIIKNHKLLVPTYQLKTINQITQKQLHGIKFIIFDKDDTITKYKQYQLLNQYKNKIAQVTQKYHCIVVSNSTTKQTPEYLENLKILKTRSKKPHNFDQIQQYLQNIQNRMINHTQIMVIGDRLLTDIYMANIHNLKSIYVKPVEISRINKHGLIVFFLRKCQELFLRNLNKH